LDPSAQLPPPPNPPLRQAFTRPRERLVISRVRFLDGRHLVLSDDGSRQVVFGLTQRPSRIELPGPDAVDEASGRPVVVCSSRRARASAA
jgi:hypothetical protein